MVRPWLRWPTIGARRVGRLAHELRDRLGELHGAARVVDLGGGGALDPGVYVEDRVDLGMLAVDHPVLDRVDRHAPRLHVGRHPQQHDVALGRRNP